MFYKAVEKHGQMPPFQASPWPKSQRSSRDALKPSNPSILNAMDASRPTKENPLKRSASQAHEQGLWQVPEQTRKKPATQGKQVTGERVEKLHFGVQFDENDFDDDSQIDLDDETPYKPEVAFKPDQPSLPAIKPSAAVQESPTSSYTIPWSSSPLDHHRQPSSIGKTAKAPAPEPTRRTIPWLSEQFSYDSGAVAKKHIPQTVEETVKHFEANRSAKLKYTTPQISKKTTSQYPWNQTQSAVKAEQKLLRQQAQKKSTKSVSLISEQANTAKKREPLARVFLSDEQKSVLRLVKDMNESVFFTGPAGTGKSVLLREIIQTLRSKYKKEPDRVAITASTGLAACNVGGVTLHSFAGIGLGKETAPELVRKIKKNQKSKNRWMRTKVLIVDEISMVDGDLFDKLEEIARTIRNNGRPFGGIQLVITGDFFQLPPVPEGGRASRFAFDANTWNTSIGKTIGLTNIFRQKDPVFAGMLNEMRLGKLTQQSIDAFRALDRPLGIQEDFQATELFSTRAEVDSANGTRMRNLTGNEWEFAATDSGTIQDETFRDKLLANCMAPKLIKLKRGAQVMLIKNIDDTLVNGSVGKVIAFMDAGTFDYYVEHEDEFGEAGLIAEDMTASVNKLRQMRNPEGDARPRQKWPLVQFVLPDGTHRQLLCHQESWKIEQPNGEVQAMRLQVPLILAWALSIHKAQGQTLEKVKVDMGRIFEKGQAYVALSRATSQQGLQIRRFDPHKVMAHDRVRTFYDGLYSVQHALEED